MSTDEISNRRCTWLLNQRGFRYWREADIGQVVPLQGTNPDFLVETPVPVRFFLELKSFEQDTLLDRIDPSVRTFSIGIMSLQKRANRLVRDAAEQLLPYADTGLPMITLTVGNGFTTTIPGLGRNQNFPNLSEKRITKAVRAALRQKYGDENVEVSCAAAFESGEWVGACEIQGEPQGYRLRE